MADSPLDLASCRERVIAATWRFNRLDRQVIEWGRDASNELIARFERARTDLENARDILSRVERGASPSAVWFLGRPPV